MIDKAKIPPRSARGWCVMNRAGHPLLWTVRRTRSLAIGAFNLTSGGKNDYKNERRAYGVQVVRCNISTEPNP